MTEEIYIDGVDVAGCEYYYRCDCKIDDDTDINLCKWHDDCYYKQLKRLEQENKALKDNNNHLQVIIDDGRAENKRFREENKELKELNKKICEDCGKEIKVYWNALEEIRENLVKLKTNDEDDFTYEYSKIEDKINEALNLS